MIQSKECSLADDASFGIHLNAWANYSGPSLTYTPRRRHGGTPLFLSRIIVCNN